MSVEVIMPQMGESIAEGTLVRWLKKPGEMVKRDEPLFEISTDKVDTEIPSPGEGVLSEIKVKEGETVPVNTVVCILSGPSEGDGKGSAKGSEGAAAPAAAPAPRGSSAPRAAAPQAAAPSKGGSAPPARAAQAAPPKAAQPAAAPAAASGREDAIRSSPLVRKIAQEHGVEISQIPGTGLGGRVTKKDILDFIAGQEGGGSAADGAQVETAGEEGTAQEGTGEESTEEEVSAAGDGEAPPEQRAGDSRRGVDTRTGAEARPAAPPRAGAAAAGDMRGGAEVRVEPMSIMRAKIAEHMLASRRTSAHVTTVHEADLTEVAKAREARKEAFLRETGVKLTFLPFIAKAVVDSLKEFPVINASIAGKEVHYHRSVHLGIAVALEDGLLVPVIKKAEEKSILGLARSIQDLAERARAKRLTPDEVQGGTFTITNYGSFGSVIATPIINQPQVAILGVGAAVKRPIVLPDSDAIAVHTMSFLSLSFDHRLIDGATADRFLKRVRELLERGPFPLS